MTPAFSNCMWVCPYVCRYICVYIHTHKYIYFLKLHVKLILVFQLTSTAKSGCNKIHVSCLRLCTFPRRFSSISVPCNAHNRHSAFFSQVAPEITVWRIIFNFEDEDIAAGLGSLPNCKPECFISPYLPSFSSVVNCSVYSK